MKKLLLPCCLSLTLLAGTCIAADTPVQLAKLEPATTTAPWNALNPKQLKLKSAAALVLDQHGDAVYSKQVSEPRPIASVTKLMTAMVILDGDLDMQEKITITKNDRDLIQLTGSRLMYGKSSKDSATLTREQMLQLALMSSENRAANALARTWPRGKAAFVEAMNKKAASLGMQTSQFKDPAGLDPGNVASAHDAALMVRAAMDYPFIRKATTTRSARVYPYKGRGELRFNNTNRLLKSKTWDIQLSKTGYLNESGRCLVMQTEIDDQPLTIVLFNSFGKLTPFGDSNRIRKWIESGS